MLSEKQRGNRVFFDDDRNSALKQRNGNDQMIVILDPQEDPLRTCQGTGLESYPLPHSQERPWLDRTSSKRNRSDGGYLCFVDGFCPISTSHNAYNTRSHQNWQTLFGVELAENVAGKQGHFNLRDPIDAFAPGAV
jgi:hypothetical protein